MDSWFSTAKSEIERIDSFANEGRFDDSGYTTSRAATQRAVRP
jgi:hypothetical protein